MSVMTADKADLNLACCQEDCPRVAGAGEMLAKINKFGQN